MGLYLVRLDVALRTYATDPDSAVEQAKRRVEGVGRAAQEVATVDQVHTVEPPTRLS